MHMEYLRFVLLIKIVSTFLPKRFEKNETIETRIVLFVFFVQRSILSARF